MKKLMEHLPLVLAVLTLLLVGSMKFDSKKSGRGCSTCQSMQRMQEGLRSRLGTMRERRGDWGKDKKPERKVER